MKHPVLLLALPALLLAAAVPSVARQSVATSAADAWKPVPVATAAGAWAAPVATPLTQSGTRREPETFKFRKIGPEPLQAPRTPSRDLGKPVRPRSREGAPPVSCAMTPHDPECR